jgi:predicted Fe-Mo cluster-binding NifX family protein
MIAIPVMRGRVAPVLNWCSRWLIFPAPPEKGPGQELWAPELGPLERLQLLQQRGVNTLICGALSADLQHCAAQLGLKVIPGVAGDIEAVLQAYRQNRLDRPEFRLPGCLGPGRYRRGLGEESCLSVTEDQGGKDAMPQGGRGAGGGQGGGQGGRGRGAGGGRGGPGAGRGAGAPAFCVCPACGAKTPHERGIPCIQVSCPQCGKPMMPQVRE